MAELTFIMKLIHC